MLAVELMCELKREGWLNGVVGMELTGHLPNPVIGKAIENAFCKNGAYEVIVDAESIHTSINAGIS